METEIKFSTVFSRDEAERLIFASMNNDPYFSEVDIKRTDSKDGTTFLIIEGTPSEVARAMFHGGQMFQEEQQAKKKIHEQEADQDAR